VRTCTISLPSGGGLVTLFSGDANSFQTTVYSLTKDTQNPTGTLQYFTNYSAGTQLDSTQHQFWQKQSLTAVITCTDLPGQSDGSSCACAPTLRNDPNGFWSLGQRNSNTTIGPDNMTYSRVFLNNSAISSAVSVQDTAGNIGTTHTTQIGVDTVPPKVTASISGTTVILNVSDPSEGGSGLWKATSSMPSGVSKTGSVIYRI
jgi:hypothetical protein